MRALALTLALVAMLAAGGWSIASDRETPERVVAPTPGEAEPAGDAVRARPLPEPTVAPPEGGGILCPDGSYLPLLNGVPSAPGIIRAEEHGPLPPVVEILVDSAGYEWYRHADDSTTTSRPQFVTDANGVRSIQIITIHNAGAPADGSIRELPLTESR